MMEQSLDMTPELSQRVSPSLIAANYILALSSQELQKQLAKTVRKSGAGAARKTYLPTCGATLIDSLFPTV